MTSKIIITGCSIIAALFFAFTAFAGMGSENFQIPTSVISGGGEPAGSENFQTNSTLGQPSPLMDSADPPYSENYFIDSGFWYTLDAEAGCPDLACFALTFGLQSGDTGYNRGCDFDGDGDVDGSDLAEFTAGL